VGIFLLSLSPCILPEGQIFTAEWLEIFPPLLPTSHNSAKRFAPDFLGFELGIGSETLPQWHQRTAGKQPTGPVSRNSGNIAVKP